MSTLSRLAVIAAIACYSEAFAGPINPPAGPVEPTHKTLTQVEPRVFLSQDNTPGDSAATFRITQPGSYYLVSDVLGESGKISVLIASSDVTVDLMGFTVRAVIDSVSGIESAPGQFSNLVVRNGTVSGFSAGAGVLLGQGSSGRGFRVEGVHSIGNGLVGIGVGESGSVVGCTVTATGGDGILTESNARVEGCVVGDGAGTGIRTGSSCMVLDCTVQNNAAQGIVVIDRCVVSRCTVGYTVPAARPQGGGAANTDIPLRQGFGGAGITATSGATITDCVVGGSVGAGIDAGTGSTIRGCTARDNGGTGIVTSQSTVSGCTVSNNGAGGISAGDQSLVSGCTVTGNQNGHGISVNTQCMVRDNLCAGNTNQTVTGAGVHCQGIRNRVEGNECLNNDRGYFVAASNNVIVRNMCSGNTQNWNIAGGNVCIAVSPATGGGFTGHFGGTPPGSTDPSINFTH